MKHIALILMPIVLAGCEGKQSLPPQELVDVIYVKQTYPENELIVVRDKEKTEAVVAFINKRQNGWSVPMFGAPVGQVYLELYKNEEFVGNFYVGPHFFGRDLDKFWSQPATETEIKQLGSILGIDLLGLTIATD